MPMLTILTGDALEQLRMLPDKSVHCCVTSPPYWGLRDYGIAGQIGLETTPAEYLAKMVAVFQEVKRVLRGDGTAWVNMGDCYAGSPAGTMTTSGKLEGGGFRTNKPFNTANTAVTGLKPKDLCGMPWRLAFALQADGWYLRSDIIWAKPGPMPESVTDRCTRSHEYLFMLTKSPRYFWDQEAVKEPQSEGTHHRFGMYGRRTGSGEKQTDSPNGLVRDKATYDLAILPNGRNLRDVWTIPSEPFAGAHFATFPTALVKPCILAGTSARGCCPKCGAPWERVVETSKEFASGSGRSGNPINGKQNLGASRTNSTPDIRMGPVVSTQTLGWRPGCLCAGLPDRPGLIFEQQHPEFIPIPCTVLDPFAGSGTVGLVALELGRRAVLIELNPDYVAMIRQRCNVTPGLALA